MENSEKKKIARVIFYERNENGTFDCIGKTQIMSAGNAINIYANTASQFIEGYTIEEVEELTLNNIQDMQDPKFVDRLITPYL